MTRRRIATVLMLGLGVLVPAWTARAQGASLPAEVIRSGQPEKQIEDYVKEWAGKLESADAETMLRARDRLLEPLEGKDVGVGTRQVYSRTAVPALQKLADGPSYHNGINAMRVAGAIATFESGSLLAAKLTAKEPAQRRFAAAQLGRVFFAIDAATPAISPIDAKTLVDKLGAALVTEQDPEAFQGMVQHLVAATRIERESFSGLRSDAFIVMAQSVGKRAQAMKGEPADAAILPTLVQAQLAARDAVLQVNPQQQLSAAAKKQALDLQGRMLAYVVRTRAMFPAGEPEKRKMAASIVNLAEVTCKNELQELNIPFQSQGMTDDFKAATPAGDGAFLQKALRLLTTLEESPLNLEKFNSK
jgi:hypothetical protein